MKRKKLLAEERSAVLAASSGARDDFIVGATHISKRIDMLRGVLELALRRWSRACGNAISNIRDCRVAGNLRSALLEYRNPK
jgi:hypothetical protein